MATMTAHVANTIVILVPEAPSWLGGSKKIPPIKPRNPNLPVQPIPSFDWKAHRERVSRILRETRRQREVLKELAQHEANK
jgi:hypothetical protein